MWANKTLTLDLTQRPATHYESVLLPNIISAVPVLMAAPVKDLPWRLGMHVVHASHVLDGWMDECMNVVVVVLYPSGDNLPDELIQALARGCVTALADLSPSTPAVAEKARYLLELLATIVKADKCASLAWLFEQREVELGSILNAMIKVRHLSLVIFIRCCLLSLPLFFSLSLSVSLHFMSRRVTELGHKHARMHATQSNMDSVNVVRRLMKRYPDECMALLCDVMPTIIAGAATLNFCETDTLFEFIGACMPSHAATPQAHPFTHAPTHSH
jgi:hypothetical protein